MHGYTRLEARNGQCKDSAALSCADCFRHAMQWSVGMNSSKQRSTTLCSKRSL